MPLGPRSRTREPVPATPLERRTLTPGTRAASASESVRPTRGASAVESSTAMDAPTAFHGTGRLAGLDGTDAEQAPRDGDWAPSRALEMLASVTTMAQAATTRRLTPRSTERRA